MMLRVAIFLGVVLTLVVIGHVYLHRKLVQAPTWRGAGLRRGLTLSLIALALLLPLGMTSGRWLPRDWAQPLAFLAFTWMGVHFYLILLFGLWDSSRGALRLSRRWARPPVRPDLGRRQVLHRGAAAAVSTASLGLSALALREGLGDISVRDVGVRLERLPKTLSGLTIVQLSDVHIGPTIGRGFLESVVEKANRARPDLVVVTGDLVDGDVPTLWEHVAPLGNLRSRFGTFFVTGNHEYYSGAEAWVRALGKLGIRVLQNERVSIGDAGGRIELLGVDDWSVYRGRADTLTRELARRGRPDAERILLAHQPRAIEEAVKLDVGLQLSGHTHGGQLFPFGALVALTTPYVAGLYRHDERTQVYVSRGTGYWGPPMRLLAPSEITRISLG